MAQYFLIPHITMAQEGLDMSTHGSKLGRLMDRVDSAGCESFHVLPALSSPLIRHVSSPAAFLLVASESNVALPGCDRSGPSSFAHIRHYNAQKTKPSPQLPGLLGLSTSQRAASSDLPPQSWLLDGPAGAPSAPLPPRSGAAVSAAAPAGSRSQPQPLHTHQFVFQGEPGSPATSEERCFLAASANVHSGSGAGRNVILAAAGTRAAPMAWFRVNTAVAAANVSSACSSTGALPFTITTTATTLAPPGDVNTDEMVEELFREHEQEAAAALQRQQRQMQQAAANLRSALTQLPLQQQHHPGNHRQEQQQQQQQQRARRSASGAVDDCFGGVLALAGMQSAAAGAGAATNAVASGGVCSSGWSWMSPAADDGTATYNSNSSNLSSLLGPASGTFAGGGGAGPNSAGALTLQFDITRLALSGGGGSGGGGGGGGSGPGTRPASAPDMPLPVWSPRAAAQAQPCVASASHATWADADNDDVDLTAGGATLDEPTLAPATLCALIAEVGGGSSDAGGAADVGSCNAGGGGMLVLDTEHAGGAGAAAGAGGGGVVGPNMASVTLAGAGGAPVAPVTRDLGDVPSILAPSGSHAAFISPKFTTAVAPAAAASPPFAERRIARGSSSGPATAPVAFAAAYQGLSNAAPSRDDNNSNLADAAAAAGGVDAMDVDFGGRATRARTCLRGAAQAVALPPLLSPRPDSGCLPGTALAAAAAKPAASAAAAAGGSTAPAPALSSGSGSGRGSGSRGANGCQLGFVAAAAAAAALPAAVVKLEGDAAGGSGVVGWARGAAAALGVKADEGLVKAEGLVADLTAGKGNGGEGDDDVELNTLLAARFKRRPGRVPKVFAKLGPIADLAKSE